jgi:hypothetical protein
MFFDQRSPFVDLSIPVTLNAPRSLADRLTFIERALEASGLRRLLNVAFFEVSHLTGHSVEDFEAIEADQPLASLWTPKHNQPALNGLHSKGIDEWHFASNRSANEGLQVRPLIEKEVSTGFRLVWSPPFQLDRKDVLNTLVTSVDAMHRQVADVGLLDSIMIRREPLNEIPLVPHRRPWLPLAPYWSYDVRYPQKYIPTNLGFQNDFHAACAAPVPEGVEKRVAGPRLTMRWVDDLFDDDHVRHQLTLQRLWWSRVSNVRWDSDFNGQGDRCWMPIGCRRNIPGIDLFRKKAKIGITTAAIDSHGQLDADFLESWLIQLERGSLNEGHAIDQLGLIFETREAAVANRESLPERFRGPVVWRGIQPHIAEDKYWQPFPADHIYPGTDKYAYYESLLPKALR